jgi:hypothetical protein
MTRNIQTSAKAPEKHPFPVSVLEALVVVAIYVVWMIVSLIIH